MSNTRSSEPAKRPWVREHYGECLWHFYGSGTLAHAACGKPAIPGSPLCSAEMPTERVCPKCQEFFPLRNV